MYVWQTPGGQVAPRQLDHGQAQNVTPSMHPRGRGVLLLNLGTPDRCDVRALRRYLTEFLTDPAVIRLPTGFGWMTGPLGRLIAYFRAPRSVEMYRRIWTEKGSPLRVITEDQVQSLEEALPRGWKVFCAMRYGRPTIVEAMRSIEAAGIGELIIVPMYPQYSDPTTGTAMRLVYEYLKRSGSLLHVTTRTTWYDDQGYINAQAELLEQYAKQHGLTPDNTHLVFSTHGLPVSYVEQGDPYPQHVSRTVALVAQRLGWPADRMSLGYQSRLGPVKWLQPYMDELLTDLARAGEKRVLICPISFTTDCLETLEEIDIRYREAFEIARAQMFLCPALNTFAPFISALKHLVLRGPQPTDRSGHALRPIQHKQIKTSKREVDLESFVMIGMSLSERMASLGAPKLAHTTPRGLRQAKRSQCEVPDLLRSLVKHTDLTEAWIWNTCHRFELYGWFTDGDGTEDQAEQIAAVKRRLFAGLAADHEVNVLVGAEAVDHLLRSAIGFTSGLPGERDILDQLRAAHRLAECAGTAGSLTKQLVDQVLDMEDRVRCETAWGTFAPEYTHVALTHIVETSGLNLPESRVVVIGGSTTSAGVLRALREKFDVPAENLTLLYRGHKNGGHLKALRKAVGGGRRERVHSYEEPKVLSLIADSDVVVFGLDRDEPILNGETLRTIRNGNGRPLTLFDFNTFGSTKGLDGMEGVTLYNAERLESEAANHANQMCASDEFVSAARSAETWIKENEWSLTERVFQAGPVSAARAGALLPASTTGVNCDGTGRDSVLKYTAAPAMTGRES